MSKIINYLPSGLKANRICRRSYEAYLRAIKYCINIKTRVLVPRMTCDICDRKMRVFERSFNKIWMQCPECMIIRANVPRGLVTLLMQGEPWGALVQDEPWVAQRPNPVRNLHKREGYFVDLFRNRFGISDVLLYGIGWSPLFGEFKDSGLNVIGCDSYRGVVDFRNEEYQQEVFFRPDNLPDYKFDLITAFEVFEHFLEPFKNLAFLACHLKEKGAICGCTDFWQEKGRLYDHGPANKPYWAPAAHVVAWSRKSMSCAAHKLGMKVRYLGADWVLWERKVFFVLYKDDDVDAYVQSLPDVLPINREVDIG